MGLPARLLFKSQTEKEKWTLEQRDQEIPSVLRSSPTGLLERTGVGVAGPHHVPSTGG